MGSIRLSWRWYDWFIPVFKNATTLTLGSGTWPWPSADTENTPCNWLIDYLWFYVPLKIFLLIWKRHHCRWRAAKFRPMLGAQGLWAGRGHYRATPAVTRDLGFSGLIRRTAPFSRHLRHTRGCRWSILTWILTVFVVGDSNMPLSRENWKIIHVANFLRNYEILKAR
jgi:hypothetical protein